MIEKLKKRKKKLDKKKYFWTYLKFKKINIERVLIENNIKTNLRPEELSYNDFINLSNTISNLIKKN